MTAPTESLLAALRLRWHRARGGWRCKLGIHRWRAHRDLGDGINVGPYPAYRAPKHKDSWRTCTWCGASEKPAPNAWSEPGNWHWRRV